MTSIHASTMGSDSICLLLLACVCVLQSTLPLWEATIIDWLQFTIQKTSIHASTMGSDADTQEQSIRKKKLQSTLPLWEATLIESGIRLAEMNFNPRFHYGKRRGNSKCSRKRKQTSIHASTMGSDTAHVGGNFNNSVLQSTLPLWEATI